MVKQISDNEIYLLIKYIKSVLWRVAKRLSYIEEAQCLKVNLTNPFLVIKQLCYKGINIAYYCVYLLCIIAHIFL